MIRRFCLYGFLKNQRYFEPFIILAFLEKGLTFLDIGLLVGFREISAIIMEIPSGAVADVFGRRRSMIFSFSSYILSFILMALASSVPLLMGAMFLYAVGDSFRTGTHKAMIFQWLQLEGRLEERTRIYGFTRSWSKWGSAVSSLVAAALVIFSGNFNSIFWISVIPYALNLINFLGYSKQLEGEVSDQARWRDAMRLTGRALKMSLGKGRLRHLILESMALEGMFKVTKDYLQPILKILTLGLSLPLLTRLIPVGWNDDQRSALVIGLVFFAYFLLMAVASRGAHRWVEKLGGESALTRALWGVNLLVFAFMAWALHGNLAWLAVLAFMALGVIQNIFRPAQISCIDRCSESEMGATILSIESQSKSLAAAVLAPLLGWLIDARVGDTLNEIGVFWPVAILGMGISSLVLVSRWVGDRRGPGEGRIKV